MEFTVTIDFSHDELLSVLRKKYLRRKDVMTIAEELREKGKREEKIQIVKKMLKIGIEIDKIVEVTNIDKEVLNIFKDEIKH
ncbi:hypothetical protein [Natronospora cellulosivora (SeqCode)]